MNKYYQILGIEDDSSLQDIKIAYREKAKQYHPDINNAYDATEQFIKINEAYMMLTQLKSDHFGEPQPQYGTYEWLIEQRRRARQRATEYAKMKYEEYINSPIYKASKVLSPIFRAIMVSFTIFIFISPIIFIIHRKINHLYIPSQNYVVLVSSMILLLIVVRVIYRIVKYQL